MNYGTGLCWLMALTYVAMAIWIAMWKKPVHFFTGGEVKAEEITDVRAYNQRNAGMWAIYAIINFIAGLIALLNSMIGYISFAILTFPGLFLLFIFHKRIYKSFKKPDSNSSY